MELGTSSYGFEFEFDYGVLVAWVGFGNPLRTTRYRKSAIIIQSQSDVFDLSHTTSVPIRLTWLILIWSWEPVRLCRLS